MGTLRASALLALAISLCPVGESIAHAQPTHEVEDEPRPWLGVAMGPGENPEGVEVTKVLRGSPAFRAGVLDGDRIVSLDQSGVKAAGDVMRFVRQRKIGQGIAMRLKRGGKELTVRVTLASLPPMDQVLRMDHLNQPAKSFGTLRPVSGMALQNLDDAKGKVVLLEFWATWCGPCRMSAPYLEKWYREFAPQGVAVLGVAAEEAGTVASFALRETPRYPLAIDEGGETSRAYGVYSLPTLFVIDRKGIVRDVVFGFNPSQMAQVEETVRRLVKEPIPPSKTP